MKVSVIRETAIGLSSFRDVCFMSGSVSIFVVHVTCKSKVDCLVSPNQLLWTALIE